VVNIRPDRSGKNPVTTQTDRREKKRHPRRKTGKGRPEQFNVASVGLVCKDLPANPCRERGDRRASLAA
jgi:hypothetical protein